jgi:putative hydrolase of the HAD superfamily
VTKAIFFDLDDTLLDHGAALRRAIRLTYDEYAPLFAGIEFDRLRDAFEAINEAMWRMYANEQLTTEGFRLRRFEELVTWCDIWEPERELVRMGRAGDLSAYYVERYVDCVTTYEGVIPMLQELARQYPLGIISNGFAGAQQGKLESAGIAGYFTHVIFSEHVGVHKPHPRIFETAVQMAGVQPEEALFIGDNFLNDIVGASAVGFRTIWFNPAGFPIPTEPGAQPAAVVGSIAELSNLLGLPVQ